MYSTERFNTVLPKTLHDQTLLIAAKAITEMKILNLIYQYENEDYTESLQEKIMKLRNEAM